MTAVQEREMGSLSAVCEVFGRAKLAGESEDRLSVGSLKVGEHNEKIFTVC